MSDKQWYYFDPENQQQGPFSIGEIRQFIAEGILNHQSFLWHDGLTTWTAANKIAGVLATPAPAPDPTQLSIPLRLPPLLLLGGNEPGLTALSKFCICGGALGPEMGSIGFLALNCGLCTLLEFGYEMVANYCCPRG